MNRTNHRHARQGIALMLVLVVIALASVLGYAMLSNAAMRSQIGHNAEVTSEAESLAESGVNLAIYYLQYPEFAPGGPFAPYEATLSHWTGTGGPIGFASHVEGTIDVQVVRDTTDKWTYDITSTGRTTSDNSIARTTQARVHVVTKYEVPHAGFFQNDLTMPSPTVFEGSIFSQSRAAVQNNSNVTGMGFRKIVTFESSKPQGDWQPFPFKPFAIPRNLSDIRSYRTYAYVNDGTTDSAGSLAAGSTLTADLNPTAENRAGIYYAEGDLTIGSLVAPTINVNGTLIVRGNLIINATTFNLAAKPGYPALIVEGNIQIGGSLPKVRIDGLCWVRNRITATPTSSQGEFEVRGGLMVAGTSPFFNGASLVKPRITHVPANVAIPDLCDVGRTVTGVQVLNWKNEK